METFTLFSTEHFWFIGGGFLGILALTMVSAFLPKYKFAQFSAIVILLIKLAELSYRHIYVGEPIYSLLPLHMCNLTLIIAILTMLTKSQKLFQLTYFWCLGALFAVITPDIKYSFPHPLTLSFYITHFYLLFAAIYGILFFNFKPTFKGWVNAFITLNIFAFIIFFINKKLGTNYLYVNRIPNFSSPLDYFGQWPYYIIVVEVIYLILTYGIYYPFRRKTFKYSTKYF
ncbi:TIGR02206 family membrane protein [uncultured Fusobacterium sp.]|uniref:YwaF family protein n=1 Tax=uncultured Fusobacterium sp. TaxID=159267 RepID=UPI00265EEF3F|nr:TIGR02206 family membrane protein [uncultured Fusobacterium sp.]